MTLRRHISDLVDRMSSPDHIQLRPAAAPAPVAAAAWEVEHRDTGLDAAEVDARQQAMRGKRIQPQRMLRKWYSEAPWRFGPVRCYRKLTATEQQYLRSNKQFWTLKQLKRLFGCLLETDDSHRRRVARKRKHQPTRSARDCFINSFSRSHGVLHTGVNGMTSAPGVEMANVLSAVGRQEFDTYDRGDRLLWRLPDGHVLLTTKRALMSLQHEDQSHVTEALRACRDMVKDEMRRMRGGSSGDENDEEGAVPSVGESIMRSRRASRRRRSNTSGRVSAAAASSSMASMAMVVVPSSALQSAGEVRPKKRPRSGLRALGIRLPPPCDARKGKGGTPKKRQRKGGKKAVAPPPPQQHQRQAATAAATATDGAEAAPSAQLQQRGGAMKLSVEALQALMRMGEHDDSAA